MKTNKVNLPQIPQQVYSFIGYILHCITLVFHRHNGTFKASTALESKCVANVNRTSKKGLNFPIIHLNIFRSFLTLKNLRNFLWLI